MTRTIKVAVLFLFISGSLGSLAEAEQKSGASDVSSKSSLPASSKESVAVLDEINVVADSGRGLSFLPDVQGTRINKGKKTTSLELANAPAVTNNNYRQALSETPGLLVSEESTPLISIGYRGLNPDRAQYMQVMKDGIPIQADMFGYPEAYYTPPLQSVERIEFIRGGSSLMYGPQPGGTLNYVTRKPELDKKAVLNTENVFGSNNYFSTYESLSGTIGPMGYLAYFHERQGDGFRDSNSDFEVISSGVKTVVNQTGDSRLTLNYDEYHEKHGEPGGLTRQNFDDHFEMTTREFDRFELERYYGDITYEKEFSDETQFDFKLYGGYYNRGSKRQRGGGFGTTPTGGAANSNDIQQQEFYNIGFEPRLRHDYELFGETHTLSFGTHTYFSASPRLEQRGEGPAADSGPVRKDSDRHIQYLSIFIENLFRWGRLSVTPGLRLENIWQQIRENQNLDKTTVPLADESEYSFVPLMGLGVVYEVSRNIELYTNISQSYRPKVFADAVPLGTNQVINGDLEEGFAWQYDVGLRGKPFPFANWDIGYFILDFNDQTGTVGNTIQNVGDAFHQGLELAADADLIGAYDYLNKTEHGRTLGSLGPRAAFTMLDAEFNEGPNEGRQPAYAPRYNLRIGAQYAWHDRVKLDFFGTFLGEHYADDASTVNRYIPSYKIWDLTGEVNLLRNVSGKYDVSVFGGINNIFDEKYFARVTSSGIDPGAPRNIYGGVKIALG